MNFSNSQIQSYISCKATSVPNTTDFQKYLNDTDTIFYLKDMINYVSMNKSRESLNTINNYFRSVINGDNVYGKSFKYITCTFRNRINFIKFFYKTYNHIISSKTINTSDLLQLSRFICPDIDIDIYNHLLGLIRTYHTKVLTSFQLFSYFSVFILYYNFLNSLAMSISSYFTYQPNVKNHFSSNLSSKLFLSLISASLFSVRDNEKPLLNLNTLINTDLSFYSFLEVFLSFPLNHQIVDEIINTID